MQFLELKHIYAANINTIIKIFDDNRFSDMDKVSSLFLQILKNICYVLPLCIFFQVLLSPFRVAITLNVILRDLTMSPHPVTFVDCLGIMSRSR